MLDTGKYVTVLNPHGGVESNLPNMAGMLPICDTMSPMLFASTMWKVACEESYQNNCYYSVIILLSNSENPWIPQIFQEQQMSFEES